MFMVFSHAPMVCPYLENLLSRNWQPNYVNSFEIIMLIAGTSKAQ
jgi:hypothetical protein